MHWASKLVEYLFNKNLSNGYAILLLTLILICITFLIWAIYYATVRRAGEELQNITWLGPKDTVKYTLITIFTIIFVSSVLFVYDFGLDKLVNLIIENAKQ